MICTIVFFSGNLLTKSYLEYCLAISTKKSKGDFGIKITTFLLGPGPSMPNLTMVLKSQKI